MENILNKKLKLLNKSINKDMVSLLNKEVTCLFKQTVHINNFADLHVPEGTNRESYRQAIEAHIKLEAEQDRALNMTNTNRRFIK